MLGGVKLQQHSVHQRYQCAVELPQREMLPWIGEQHVIPLRASSLKPIQCPTQLGRFRRCGTSDLGSD